jgi:DNA-directed RNA polymerase III subunit RPC8
LITGKIKNCTRDGIFVSLGFFDDIFIPKDELQHPSRFDEAEQAWVWEYPLEDGASHDLFMDVGEVIKFRVIDEEFTESEPSGPPDQQPASEKPSTSSNQSNSDNNMKPPYKIIGAINESGLGVECWWKTNENNEVEDEDDDDG